MILKQGQRKVLDAILDRYENSKSYKGENKTRQSFWVPVCKIWPQYESDFTDVSEIEEIERQLKLLEEEGLIIVKCDKNGVYETAVGVPERINDYYEVLGRKEKNELAGEELRIYESYCDRKDELGAFCREQAERISSGKKALFDLQRAKKIISLLDRILNNTEVLYERELSVSVLHDTKLFEKSFRKTVCRIMREKGDYEDVLNDEDDERIIQMMILERHQIYANPGYVYIKGEAHILFTDDSIMETKIGLPIALSMDLLSEVKGIRTASKKIITIENLTTFHRFCNDGYFCIFLSGYHSSRITQFLRKIENCEDKEWFHFGDIDPDGFMILNNLRLKTGLPFQPFDMDIKELKKYEDYLKPLEKQDLNKADHLLKMGLFPEVMDYMIKNDCKLEQEIIKTG